MKSKIQFKKIFLHLRCLGLENKLSVNKFSGKRKRTLKFDKFKTGAKQKDWWIKMRSFIF